MLDTSRLRDLAISDSGFVFNPTTGHTYNINSTANHVLKALKDGATEKAIVDGLMDTFDAEPESDLARDVSEFISRLREHGLVK